MHKSRPSLQTLLLVFLIAFLGIAVTQALFQDVERSQKGVFVLGTLELNVKDPAGGDAESIKVTNIGAGDALEGSKAWLIKNVGSLPGRFSLSLADLANFENGCNEPELLVDSTCDDPGEAQGELGQHVKVKFSVQEQGKTREVAVINLAAGASESLDAQWSELSPNFVIPSGKSVELLMDWSTAEAAFGNEAQSDSITFDLLFMLEQVTGKE